MAEKSRGRKANEITRKATSRGTDMHTLTENYLKNKVLPKVKPLPDFLFKIAKPDLKKIDNIHTLEGSLQRATGCCWYCRLYC